MGAVNVQAWLASMVSTGAGLETWYARWGRCSRVVLTRLFICLRNDVVATAETKGREGLEKTEGV